MAMTVRTIRPETINTASANATCATMRVARVRFPRTDEDASRPPSLRSSLRLGRDDCSAGRTPKSMGVTTESRKANVSRLKLIARRWKNDSGDSALNALSPP